MDRPSTTRKTMLPYGKQWIDGADIDAVIHVLKSDFITQGPAIEQFEAKVASYVGAKHAVAFCNGTAALHGACFAAGIGVGDEVITTPITFVASSNCVLYTGGVPVFADIRPDTYNIDTEQIEKAISERTKAIIAVDFSGQPAEMDTLERIARKHNLTLIEDAAHSLGASYDARKVGTMADMTMFSFHPVKHITTGEGGMIVTDNDELYEKLVRFRSHGITRNTELMSCNEGPWYYEMQELGYNYRMTDIQAALGVSQMDKLDEFIARRKDIAAKYNRAFASMPGLIIPFQHPKADSSWHLYVLGWNPSQFKVGRNTIFEELRTSNIGVNVHYIPVYRQPFYRSLGYDASKYMNAEYYYERSLSLPIFPGMSDTDVDDVITAVLNLYDKYKC